MNYFNKVANSDSLFGELSELTNLESPTHSFMTKYLPWIILIILIISACAYLLTRKSDNLQNVKHDTISIPQKSNDENVIIVLLMTGCKFCEVLDNNLEQNDNKIGNKNVRKINIDTPEGKHVIKKIKDKGHQINGYPVSYLESSNKIAVGAQPLDKLSESLSPTNDETILIVVGRDNCKFCIKTYELLDENNIKYKKIESDSDKGKELLKKHSSNGVPLLCRGNKFIAGLPTLESLKTLE